MLELLLQLFLEVFGELLLELGLSAFKGAAGRRNHHPLVACCGYLVLGALLGALSLWYWPARLLAPLRLPGLGVVMPPGLSVLVAPLVGGSVLHVWGRWRRSQGHATTNLATFWGAASLLFAYALVRVLWSR